MRPEALRELSRPRTAVDRLRARTTTLAAAGMGVALLAAISIATLRSTALTDRYVDDGQHVTRMSEAPGLVPFLAQSGLRPGAVLAAALLVVPFAALAAQALGVGRLALEREATQLAVAGATSGDLRRISGSRTVAAFVRGGLLAGPAYLVAWLLLGLALPPGSRLIPVPVLWTPLAWLLVVALLALVGWLLGGRGAREHGGQGADLVSLTSRAARPPHRLLTWLPALAGAALFLACLKASSTPLFAGVLLVFALSLLVSANAVVARRAATSTVRGRDAAVALLAGAQRRGSPRAAGAVAGVLFMCGLAVGVAAALSAGVVAEASGGGLGLSALTDSAFYLGGAGLAAVLAGVGVLVALLAMALSLTDHLLGARRSVAATAVLGVEERRLVGVQAKALSATAVPATVAGTLLGGLGYALLEVSNDSLSPALAGLAGTAATALLVGLLVALACRLVAQLLAGRVRAASALENVRTP